MLRTISSTGMINIGFFASANAAIQFGKQLPVNHLEEHCSSARIHRLLCSSTV